MAAEPEENTVAPRRTPSAPPSLLRTIARLVVPLACVGCGAPDMTWCAACRHDWQQPIGRVDDFAARLDRCDGRQALPVWAIAPLAGTARRALVAWKDGGRRDADAYLGERMEALARMVGASLRRAGAAGCAVVPVPSTRAAVRTRGVDLTAMLARRVCDGLEAEPMPVLTASHTKVDQSSLGVRQRGRNAVASLAFARSAPAMRGRIVVLVDDIVTTGATLAAAEALLCSRQAIPIAALCLAATPPPGYPGVTRT